MRAHLGQDHRYAHVVRVARLADRLAQRHGFDAAAARTAAMLHDLARLYDEPRLLAECERHAIPIDAFARRNPIVLHAPLGAALATEMFGIGDPAILSAIAKHTLADADMSALDTIVYLADGLEPGRRFAERAELERLAFDDPAAAMHALLRTTLAYLRSRDLDVAPQTLAALDTYERQRRTVTA